MPNNNALYNAVIAGVTGGGNNRWLRSSTPSSYTSFADAVVLVATAVDSAIAPIIGGPSQGQIDLLRSITQGVFESRFPLTNTDYSTIAASIAAQFTELSTKLLAITIEEPSITAQVTKTPTGFENQTSSTLSFTDLTRTFTISPVVGSYNIWYHGTRLVKNSVETIVWDNVEGIQAFYFDGNGTIQKTTNPAVIQSMFFGGGVPIAVIYWDLANQRSIRRIEERHDISLPPSVHGYLHEFVGTVIESGGAQLANFTITGGAGNLAANAQFSFSNYVVVDEDIRIPVVNGVQQVLSPIANIPIYYLSGANTWREKAADAYPIIYSGTAGYVGANGRLPWNQLVGANWQLTQVTELDFVLCHYFGTTDSVLPTMGIVGQAVYTSAALARVGANYEINRLRNLLNLFSTEKRAIATVIFQTGAGYANVPKAKVVVTDLGDNYIDWLATPIFTGVVKDA